MIIYSEREHLQYKGDAVDRRPHIYNTSAVAKAPTSTTTNLSPANRQYLKQLGFNLKPFNKKK